MGIRRTAERGSDVDNRHRQWDGGALPPPPPITLGTQCTALHTFLSLETARPVLQHCPGSVQKLYRFGSPAKDGKTPRRTARRPHARSNAVNLHLRPIITTTVMKKRKRRSWRCANLPASALSSVEENCSRSAIVAPSSFSRLRYTVFCRFVVLPK